MNYISRSQREKILKDKQLEAETLSSEIENENESLELSQKHQIDQIGLLDDNEISDMKIQEELQSKLIISNETQQENAISESKDLLMIGSDTYPLLHNMPTTYAQTVREAAMIFNYVLRLQTNETTMLSSPITLSPKLITSYLSILIKKFRYSSVFDFYQNIIPKYNVKLNGWIFLSILNVCYKHKRVDESWSVWQDWENWRKEQNKKIYKDEYDKKKAFKEVGINEKMEYETYKLMIRILAR